ncbi:DUF3617 domain-containing protein [Thioalkalivibrio paradoxus]|uniref:DUF3617 domain-containing protein n=1 Tax=Thioalkalivibrio paradoxus TaxID=108010 RepID=UPI00022C1BA3|nr:DUF3617 family protein [Thioalkalivibrio paradoxus]
MPYRSLLAVALFALPLAVSATQPNLQPGDWEMVTTTTFANGMMPEQRETSRECVTAEDLSDGQLFDVDVEECEITSQDVRADGMNYTMSCQHEDGMDMTMDAEMHFLGDRAEGTMSARMNTPMGPMQMEIVLEGRRLGDC